MYMCGHTSCSGECFSQETHNTMTSDMLDLLGISVQGGGGGGGDTYH